jgi:hypothetical protein
VCRLTQQDFPDRTTREKVQLLRNLDAAVLVPVELVDPAVDATAAEHHPKLMSSELAVAAAAAATAAAVKQGMEAFLEGVDPNLLGRQQQQQYRQPALEGRGPHPPTQRSQCRSPALACQQTSS